MQGILSGAVSHERFGSRSKDVADALGIDAESGSKVENRATVVADLIHVDAAFDGRPHFRRLVWPVPASFRIPRLSDEHDSPNYDG